MKVILSPAKRLDTKPLPEPIPHSQPQLLNESYKIVNEVKKMSTSELGKLMKVNAKLAQQNFERFQMWNHNFTPENAKQALLSFSGDVFAGIDASSLSNADLLFAQEQLRILSGLYGMLKPLDLMQPYRLEMGTKLGVDNSKNLYEFWHEKIKAVFNSELANDPVLINLASQEYFKVLNPLPNNVRVITPVFKEYKDGKYKFVHVLGKRARGLMTRFIITNKIRIPEKMKLFDSEGYYYNDQLSSENEWVFIRT